jgi:hypothetical protein
MCIKGGEMCKNEKINLKNRRLRSRIFNACARSAYYNMPLA